MHDLNWLILSLLLGFAGILYIWLLGDSRKDPRS